MDVRNEDGQACDGGWRVMVHVVGALAAVETARVGVHAHSVTVFQCGSTVLQFFNAASRGALTLGRAAAGGRSSPDQTTRRRPMCVAGANGGDGQGSTGRGGVLPERGRWRAGVGKRVGRMRGYNCPRRRTFEG